MFRIESYPKDVTLSDGTAITLRPMVKEDEQLLLSLFLAVPEQERWFLKEDVTSPQTIRAWADDLDYRRSLPLLALDKDGAIVADALLIRRRGGSRAHIGELRVVVRPDFRGRGLGVTLLRELCDIANDAGLEKVIIEVVEHEKDMLEAAEWMGFYRLAMLDGLAKDQHGKDCALVIMVMPLGRYYEWSKF